MDEYKVDDFHGFENSYLNVLDDPYFTNSSAESISIPEYLGSGTIVRTKLRPGMELIVADCRLNQSNSLRFKSDIPMVELSFWLHGNCDINMLGQQLHNESNQSRFAFTQHMDAEMHFINGRHLLACEIRLEESIFFEMIQPFGGHAEMDMKYLLASEPVRLFQQWMDPAEQQRVRQLIHCPYVPALRNMYWEGVTLDLLASYIQRYLFDESASIRRKGKRLSRTDIDNVRAASELLVSRMDNPPSLPELSRMVGLSEFKLKAGFRDLYETTVFGFLRDKRMAHALYLLESEQASVYEVAIATGYNNPSHFAAVFREKFGINPGKWKKQKN